MEFDLTEASLDGETSNLGVYAKKAIDSEADDDPKTKGTRKEDESRYAQALTRKKTSGRTEIA